MNYPPFFIIVIMLFSCQDPDLIESNCPQAMNILDEFVVDQHYIITIDGQVLLKKNDGCEFLLQYYSPDFQSNYFSKNDTVFAYANQDYSIPVINNFEDDFNGYINFQDLFMLDPSTIDNKWTDFVLLSPQNPTVADYVALRKCILGNTCDFDDNRIDLVPDAGNTNGKLKFTAVTPSAGMTTSKASIENTLVYAKKDDVVTIEGDFWIEEGFPFSIIDLENKWFHESPGIRLVFDEQKNLSVELKYGLKPWYRQTQGQEVSFPTGEWVNVKAEFLLKEDQYGRISVWQNNVLIIETSGQTLPTHNSIQSSIEVGITATDQLTVMYLDNFKIQVGE